MPDPAPLTRPERGATVVHYRRTYADVLGRPFEGAVTLIGQTRTDAAGQVTVPAPVTVSLAAGVLEVDLPPDTYRVVAALRTADGVRTTDSHTVTLEAS